MPCNQNWSCYPCIMVCEYSYYEFDIKSMHIKIYASAILGTRAIKCMLYQSFEIMQNSFFMFACVKVCMNMCRMCMWGYIYLRLCKFSMDSCINEDNQNWHGMWNDFGFSIMQLYFQIIPSIKWYSVHYSNVNIINYQTFSNIIR